MAKRRIDAVIRAPKTREIKECCLGYCEHGVSRELETLRPWIPDSASRTPVATVYDPLTSIALSSKSILCPTSS